MSVSGLVMYIMNWDDDNLYFSNLRQNEREEEKGGGGKEEDGMKKAVWVHMKMGVRNCIN